MVADQLLVVDTIPIPHSTYNYRIHRMMITEETRIKISKTMTGIVRSDETRRKMRDAHLGIKPSQTTCSKMRQAAFARWESERELKKGLGSK